MPLNRIGGEDITVSTTAIGPTATQVTNEVLMAVFAHRSGGEVHWNISVDPTAAGSNGDIDQADGDKWGIWGHDNVLNMKMIRTGGSDGIIAVQYFGTGRT